MAWKKAQRNAIPKAPSPFCTFDPQPIHRRDQPEHACDAAQRGLRGGFPVNLGAARRAVSRT